MNSGELTLTGESALTLAEQGSLVNLGFLHFQEAVWAVQDASLFSWGWLDMAASTLEVGEGGFVNLRAFGTALDEASTVVNRGNLSLYAYQDGDSFTLAGTLQNEGELSLGACYPLGRDLGKPRHRPGAGRTARPRVPAEPGPCGNSGLPSGGGRGWHHYREPRPARRRIEP